MDTEQAATNLCHTRPSYLDKSKIEEIEKISLERFCVEEEHNENMKLDRSREPQR